jgi:hypothetical protein
MTRVSVWTAPLVVSLFLQLFVTRAFAAVPGDIDDNNKVDLVEAIYALRAISQSNGSGFTPGHVVGKTFFQIEKNSTGGETCIIESTFGETTVAAKEWLYVNDDHWVEGCQEEYIPNEAGTFSYEIVQGILTLSISGENWTNQLVEEFEESWLTANPDGPSLWYFSRDKVNSLLEPPAKFTQELLSANPWYLIETYPLLPTDTDCNGKFLFDSKMTLTVEYVDNEIPGQASGTYLVHEGNLTTVHDSKVETDTIQSYNAPTLAGATQMTAIKSVLKSDGSTDGTGTRREYFKNRQEAIAFLTAKGKPSCFPAEIE